MITHAGSKFHDSSISPKINQILSHWGYELKRFFVNLILDSKFNFCKKKKNFNGFLSFVFTQYKNEWNDTKIWQY